MEEKNPVDVAIRFIEKINRRDFDGLSKLMAPDHKAMDEKGTVNQGRETATSIIANYTSKFPDFQLHINEVFHRQETVIIIGRTTGSCSDTGRNIEIKDRLLYMIKVKDGLATEFQYAMDDTKENRAALGIDTAEKITK